MGSENLFQKYSIGFDRLGDALGSSDVFDRKFGAELAGWEMDQYKQFREHLQGGRYRYRGFMHLTRDTRLSLVTPSPWLLEGELLLFPVDLEPPPDGAYAEVSGRFVGMPEASSAGARALLVESVNILSSDYLSDIKPPMNLRGLSNLLFEDVGMSEAAKRIFARLIVSSPPLDENVGGFSTGIQAIASKAQVNRLLSFMRRIMPPSFRGRWPTRRTVRGATVLTPRFWRLLVGSVKPTTAHQLCINRRDPQGFREVSLGIETTPETSFLPDVPLAIAHEDFWIETKNPTHLQLPLLKSAITFQMLTPKISQKTVEAGTKHVLSGLDDLKESFGFEDASLSRGSLLDADVLGRPLSVVRLARSSARAGWRETVTAKDLKHAWDRILEPALKEFIEITELKSGLDHRWGKDRPIHKFNTKVLRALKKLDTGIKGNLGPTLDEIAEEAGVERHVAAEALILMKNSGVLYEPRNGHYRLV